MAFTDTIKTVRENLIEEKLTALADQRERLELDSKSTVEGMTKQHVEKINQLIVKHDLDMQQIQASIDMGELYYDTCYFLLHYDYE